jgi:hypothetical protein
MDNEHMVLKTDKHGSLIGLPSFPPNMKVEAFFKIVDQAEGKTSVQRVPCPDIAGKTLIKGNIIDTVDIGEWNLDDNP